MRDLFTRPLKRAWATVLCLLSLLVLNGCGALKKAFPGAVNGGTQSPGRIESSFQAWVLPNGADREFPVEDSSQALNKENLSQGSDLVFQDTIPVREVGQVGEAGGGPSELFLVWPEQALGSLVQYAHFEHRVKNSLNQNSGETNRDSASFDERTRRWFIPFSKLFPGDRMRLDPADLHWVTLDLLLKDLSRRRIRIGIRVAGPLQLIKRTQLPPDSGNIPESLVDSAKNPRGWTILREQFTNLSSRPLVFKARVELGDRFAFESWIMQPHFLYYPDRPHGIGDPFYYYTQANFQLVALRVQGEKNGVKDIPFARPRSAEGMSEWVSAPIPPYETLTIEWLAVPVAGTLLCPMSGPQSFNLSWTDGDGNYHPDYDVLTTTFAFAALGGNWSREVEVIEESAKGGPILSKTTHFQLQEKTENRISAGQRPPYGAPLHCQGMPGQIPK